MDTRILMSILMIGVVAMAAGAGTFAQFSDTETSNGNTFTAGTLDLLVNDGNWDGSAVISWENKKPGDSGSYTFKLENNGNLAGTLAVAVTMSYGPGDETEPETAVTGNDATGGDLDKYLGVKLTQKVGNNAATYIVGSDTAYAPLEDLESAWETCVTSMAAKDDNDDSGADTVIYVLDYSIASDIYSEGDDGLLGTTGSTDVDDNIIQGDTATMQVIFTLTQS